MPIKKNEISWELDLTDEMQGLSRSDKKAMKSEIGELLVSEIERTTRGGRSPVNGASFKPLSKEYKAIKKKQGKGGRANLHLDDKMINAINDKNTRKGVKLEITKKKEKLKLFNHNVGDTVPKRQSMPDDAADEVFNNTIMKKVDKVIQKYTPTEPTEKELAELLRKEQIKADKKGTGVTITIADIINGS